REPLMEDEAARDAHDDHGDAGHVEGTCAGPSAAEGAASTGPERTRPVREDRSASGNGRMSRSSSKDAHGDRRSQGQVGTEVDGAVLTVTIDRPQARNAVDPETAHALEEAFQRF